LNERPTVTFDVNSSTSIGRVSSEQAVCQSRVAISINPDSSADVLCGIQGKFAIYDLGIASSCDVYCPSSKHRIILNEATVYNPWMAPVANTHATSFPCLIPNEVAIDDCGTASECNLHGTAP
jgi:hypothetical protein